MSWVNPEWLKATGYEYARGSKRSNLAYYMKKYVIPGITIQHMIHLNGTWTLQITPKVPQEHTGRMMTFCSNVLMNAFSGLSSYHVVVRRFESSRIDSSDVKDWLKANNIREIKAYLHDQYEARVEITYLEPCFSPSVARILGEM